MDLGLQGKGAIVTGGSLGIDPKLSERAIMTHIGEPLGLDLVQASSGIRKIANVAMARAIRSVTVERGRDARGMVLMAFGGGGPVHAVEVAGLLGIREVIVPAMSGVFCSVGMLASDVEHNFVRNVLRPLAQLDADSLLDDLQQATLPVDEPGAEGCLAGGDQVEAALQEAGVQRPGESNGAGYVVEAREGIHLVLQPQSALGSRGLQGGIACDPGDGT